MTLTLHNLIALPESNSYSSQYTRRLTSIKGLGILSSFIFFFFFQSSPQRVFSVDEALVNIRPYGIVMRIIIVVSDNETSKDAYNNTI